MLCEVTIAVRTKALKCLASVIEVDPTVLAWVSCSDFLCVKVMALLAVVCLLGCHYLN